MPQRSVFPSAKSAPASLRLVRAGPIRFSCIMPILSPLSLSCRFAISNKGAASAEPGAARGNCTIPCLEFEFRIIESAASRGAG
ncbi:MAG: hypothetical protein DME91_09090 [Verrucomicrobia bacterium]|nr:MAG: hypothetical protein DME91_09090 [Verrucomicrobiota bacterium]